MLPELSSAYVALISAICGGVGLKVVDHILARDKDKDDRATAFRDELRQELKYLKEENKAVDELAQEFREKYYKAVESYIVARAELGRVIDEAYEECGVEITALPLPPLSKWLEDMDLKSKEKGVAQAVSKVVAKKRK